MFFCFFLYGHLFTIRDLMVHTNGMPLNSMWEKKVTLFYDEIITD